MDRYAKGYEVLKRIWHLNSCHKEDIPGFVPTKASGMVTGLTSCQLYPMETSGSKEKNAEQHLKLQ